MRKGGQDPEARWRPGKKKKKKKAREDLRGRNGGKEIINGEGLHAARAVRKGVLSTVRRTESYAEGRKNRWTEVRDEPSGPENDRVTIALTGKRSPLEEKCSPNGGKERKEAVGR